MFGKSKKQIRMVPVPSEKGLAEEMVGDVIRSVADGRDPKKAVAATAARFVTQAAGSCPKCRGQLTIQQSLTVDCPECRGRGFQRRLLGLRKVLARIAEGGPRRHNPHGRDNLSTAVAPDWIPAAAKGRLA